MLTNKQIKKLKALANGSKHKYQIGKSAIDVNVIALLNNALKAHELIKVYFNKSMINEIDRLTEEIVNKTESTLVGKIGHTIILYKTNLNKADHIIL